MKMGPKPRPLQIRLEEKVEMIPECGCWIWMGHTRSGRNKDYGMFRIGASRNVYLHRVSWELHYGKIPKGMQVLHRCDTPSCVNPHHLFLGTPADNMLDKTCKGRSKYGTSPGELNGHARLSKEQVIKIINDSRSQRKIAGDYSVSKAAVQRIKARRAWTCLNL